MWILVFFLFCGSGSLVRSLGNIDILGKGRWEALNILPCDDSDQYDMECKMSRRKMNRTHDCISFSVHLDTEFNNSYGVEMVAYKEVDGGFKFFQTLSDTSVCEFFEKFTGDNWSQILSMANVDPPECPIPAGDFIVDDYVMDYRLFTKEGLYGTYDVYMYFIYMARRISCIRLIVRFDKEGQHDEDDDEDDR